MLTFLITTILILLTIAFIYVKRFKIQRFAIRKYNHFLWRQRNRKRIKFSFDNERQKRTIKIIEKLIRDKDSRLYHETDNDNYYIENGEIFGIFNAKLVSIVNGKFNNSVLIYEALYNDLQEKFRNRVRKDVSLCEERINAKVDNIITFINNDVDSH
jgi:hypothetical protein